MSGNDTNEPILQSIRNQEHINTKCQSITQPFILYTIKILYCQGDMFRPLLGHLQALWENTSKSYLYKQLLGLFSQRAWICPNKGRNMSPWQYTIFIVYKIQCCVIDWHVVFIFISVISQLDAQNVCFTVSLFHASTCFEHHVLIIRRSKLHYTASGNITPIGVMLPEAV